MMGISSLALSNNLGIEFYLSPMGWWSLGSGWGKERGSQSFLVAGIVYSIGPMAGGLPSPEGLLEESLLGWLRDKACFRWSEFL